MPSGPDRADAAGCPRRARSPDGSVNDFCILPADDVPLPPPAAQLGIREDHAVGCRLLVSSSSLVDPSCYSLVDLARDTCETVSSVSDHGRSLRLARSRIKEFTYPGTGGHDVHAITVLPPDFSEKKWLEEMALDGDGAWRASLFLARRVEVVEPSGRLCRGRPHCSPAQYRR